MYLSLKQACISRTLLIIATFALTFTESVLVTFTLMTHMTLTHMTLQREVTRLIEGWCLDDTKIIYKLDLINFYQRQVVVTFSCLLCMTLTSARGDSVSGTQRFLITFNQFTCLTDHRENWFDDTFHQVTCATLAADQVTFLQQKRGSMTLTFIMK